MGRNYDAMSALKTKEIKKVLLNEKDYTFQDFTFKVLKDQPNINGLYGTSDYIEVYHFDILILKLSYTRASN